MGWASAEKTTPENGEVVLALCVDNRGRQTMVIAEYIGKFTREYDPDYDDEFDGDCVYDHATESYYWPGGWYESIHSWYEYDFVKIHDVVTHWMPLPAPPAAL